MDTSKYKTIYLEEAYTHLSGIENSLLSLEEYLGSESPDSVSFDSAIDNLFRHYHTLKGMSASMGYEETKELAHVQEDLLSRLRSKEIDITSGLIEVLLGGLDALRELVSIVEEGSERKVETRELINSIEAAGTGTEAAGQTKPEAASEATGAIPVDTEKPQSEISKPRAPRLKLSSTMKVNSRVFDELLTTVGDLYMELSSFRTAASTPGTIAYKDSVFALGKTLNTLHSSIITARMLPIANLTETLPRVVHDLSKRSGKEIGLSIETGNISLDRSILENLGGPLLHIIRNCVDHAIETPDERRAADKPARASITLKAYPIKDRVVVEIEDDGRGMDIEKIKAKALGAGYTYEKIDAMSSGELLMLVCLPGLSTTTEITDTSGRGVGMDVVKSGIETIGGRLSIDSASGKGSTITMELPRTTSIIKALFVSVEEELFLIPLSRVSKVLEATAEEVSSGLFNLESQGGLQVPLVDLAPGLGIEKKTTREQYAIVFVETDHTELGSLELGPAQGGLVGIVVDDFGLEIDAYIKPLQPPITNLLGVSGITVTGDGRPVFLVDVTQVTEKTDRKP